MSAKIGEFKNVDTLERKKIPLNCVSGEKFLN
jgi:hypothetical protein